MALSRPQVRALRVSLQQALDKWTQESVLADGMKATVGNATIGDGYVTFKVDVAEVGEGGIVQSKEAADFKLMAKLYGLSADDLGREFESHGRTFRITGLKARATKHPVLCECLTDGKEYVFTAPTVARLLKITA